MKALIRNNGETVMETDGIVGIDWTTGAPLTNPAWAGGAYALCEDCPVQDPEPQDFDITSVSLSDPSSPEEEPSTITRLIATFNKEKYDARKEAINEIHRHRTGYAVLLPHHIRLNTTRYSA